MPNVAGSKEPRTPDDLSSALGDRLQVPDRQEIGRQRLHGGFNLSKKAFYGELSDSHNVVVDQPIVEPRKKSPDDVRVTSEEE